VGRHRIRDFDLPPGVFRRGDRYYYGKQGIALGGPAEWFRKYAELRTGEPEQGTFADAAAVYSRDELKSKAAKTQSEYSRQLVTLVKVFGAQALDEITPGDVADFLKLRPRIAGTREKALLSAVFNFARARHLTNARNPCAGIRGKKSKRTRYVEDAELTAAIAAARKAGDATLADYLALLYRAGQRPSDTLRIRAATVGGRLIAQQTKTGAQVRIKVAGPLKALHKRLSKTAGSIGTLIQSRGGESVKLQALRRRFRKLGFDWQLRDIRAKAASDLPDVQAARGLLGHAHESTTDAYRRSRMAGAADPVMRSISDKRRRFRTSK
jgi:hypothetical protein